jgi:hypothetical protein
MAPARFVFSSLVLARQAVNSVAQSMTTSTTCFGDPNFVCPGSICNAPAFEPVIAGVDGLWAGDDSHPAATCMQESLSGLLNGVNLTASTGILNGENFHNYATTYSETGWHTAYNFDGNLFAKQVGRDSIADFYGTYVARHATGFAFTNPPQAYNASMALEQNNCITQEGPNGPNYVFFTFKSNDFAFAGGTAIFNSAGNYITRQYATITTTQHFNESDPTGTEPGPVELNGTGPVMDKFKEYWNAIENRDVASLVALYSETAKLHYYNAATDVAQFEVFPKDKLESYYLAIFEHLGNHSIEPKIRQVEEKGEAVGNVYVAWTCLNCSDGGYINMSSTLIFNDDGKISGEGALNWVDALHIVVPDNDDQGAISDAHTLSALLLRSFLSFAFLLLLGGGD